LAAQFLVIDERKVQEIIEMTQVLRAVEEAFERYARGEAKMPPKLYLELPQFNGDFRAMPAWIGDYAGLKWVNVHPDNKGRGLPTVMGKVLLNDPETGEPLACIDGTTLTNYRTGAAAGVASKYLARNDSSSLGLIGLGEQAKTQLMAISEVFELQEVLLFDVDEEQREEFVRSFSGFNFKIASLKETCSADIVSTTTPVREPIIEADWIEPGTHINAMGADAQGKQEFSSELYRREDLNLKIIVDDAEQALHSGEVNVPYREGVLEEEDIYGELPLLVKEKREVREREDVTLFDSTGLAIQDIATASTVYESVTEGSLKV